LSSHTKAHESTISKAFEPITSIPSTYKGMVDESVARVGRGAEQIGQGDKASL
jgi:hypothetical protein